MSFQFIYNLKIIANDLEYYSYIINFAQLCVPYTNKLKDIITKLNGELKDNNINKVIEGYKLITNNYSPKGIDKRMFWTEENAISCDYLRYRIDSLLKNNDITINEHNFLVASLLCTMDKVANTTSIYGAFLKKFKKSASVLIELKPIHTSEIKENINQVTNLDINSNEILDKTYDIVYLDPPYNERQYSSNYHPLNYLA